MSQTKQKKSFRGEWKQIGDEGSFEAVIATLGVVDSDGDVVEPGAMTGNGSVPILPAHNQGSVPLGKAKIEERGNQVIAVGRFNLDVEAARDWFNAIKFDLQNPPAVQEYSWGYFPTKFRFEDRDGDQVRVLEGVDMLEVSPVLRGASVGTRTIAAKEKEGVHPEGGDADALAHADETPPTLESPTAASGVKLMDQLLAAREAVEAALKRFTDLKLSRDRQGKNVSDAASAEVIRMATSVADLSRELEEILALMKSLEDTVDEAVKPTKVAAALADWTAHKARFGR